MALDAKSQNRGHDEQQAFRTGMKNLDKPPMNNPVHDYDNVTDATGKTKETDYYGEKGTANSSFKEGLNQGKQGGQGAKRNNTPDTGARS